MSRAVLSLGSNLGDRLGYLTLAVEYFREVLVSVSGVYETKPWGVKDQDDFLNAVCVVDDPSRDQWDWLASAQNLEAMAHRVRERRWGPRTLDVDIITVDDIQQNDPRLTLPHPRAADRAFVLIPWLEIEPRAELVGLGLVRDLCENLPWNERKTVRLQQDLSLRNRS